MCGCVPCSSDTAPGLRALRAGEAGGEAAAGRQAAEAPSPLPHLTRWYGECCKMAAFESARGTILAHWARQDARGQFDPIRDEVRHGGGDFKWSYP